MTQNYAEKFPTVELKADDVLFEQGDQADALYILKSGELGVRMRSADNENWLEIDRLQPPSVVGEMGLLSNQPRSATVYARSDCKLHVVSAESYAALNTKDKRAFTDLAKQAQPRWQRLQLAQIITDLFGQIEPETLQHIQSKLTWKHYATGDILMRQGEVADAMVIIVSGRVQFVGEDGDVLGEAASHETVGEFALLSTGVRSATVRALRDTSVAIMTQAVFEELIAEHPRLLRSISKIIVERRQRSLGLLPPKKPIAALTLTLIPTQPTIDCGHFAKQLQSGLQRYGETLVLDGVTFEAQTGLSAQTALSDPNNVAVVRWLEEQEARHQHVIFVPDAEWTAWSRRCISQSDRVLLLGDRTKPAEISPLEQQLFDTHPHTRRDLVMWHPADTDAPTETARWLDPRSVKTHYHVRDGDEGHFGRMARRLTNRAIGLVLAGGGARGFVHVGAFRGLEETAVPIDYIGGTSFGSLIGVSKAREIKYSQMLEEMANTAHNKLLFDRTLPLVALNNSAAATRTLQRYYGDLNIEDLWIPYFAIAANISTQKMVIIDRGPVWQAVRKSISIPGVFTPVVEDGELIVDGGVINNFPVDVLAERAETSRIIGIRCAPTSGKKYTYDMKNAISGWRVLARQLNPFAKRLRTPSLGDTIMRSLVVNSSRLAEDNAALCDLYFNMRPKGFSLLNVEPYREIIDFGYKHSIEGIQAWAAQQTDIA